MQPLSLNIPNYLLVIWIFFLLLIDGAPSFDMIVQFMIFNRLKRFHKCLMFCPQVVICICKICFDTISLSFTKSFFLYIKVCILSFCDCMLYLTVGLFLLQSEYICMAMDTVKKSWRDLSAAESSSISQDAIALVRRALEFHFNDLEGFLYPVRQALEKLDI